MHGRDAKKKGWTLAKRRLKEIGFGRRWWSFQHMGRIVATEHRNPKKGNERESKMGASGLKPKVGGEHLRRRAQWLEGVRPRSRLHASRHIEWQHVKCKFVKCVLYGPCKVTEITSRCLTQCEKARVCVVKWNCYGLVKGAQREWKRGIGQRLSFFTLNWSQVSQSIFSILLLFTFESW
jgi:hypothetical protein